MKIAIIKTSDSKNFEYLNLLSIEELFNLIDKTKLGQCVIYKYDQILSYLNLQSDTQYIFEDYDDWRE